MIKEIARLRTSLISTFSIENGEFNNLLNNYNINMQQSLIRMHIVISLTLKGTYNGLLLLQRHLKYA